MTLHWRKVDDLKNHVKMHPSITVRQLAHDKQISITTSMRYLQRIKKELQFEVLLKEQLDRIEKSIEEVMDSRIYNLEMTMRTENERIEKKLDALCEESILVENQRSYERNNPVKRYPSCNAPVGEFCNKHQSTHKRKK